MNRIEVNLQDIFWAMKKYAIWIILACVLGSVGTYTYTKLFVTPVYSTKVSFVSFASVREGTGVSSNELTADMNIANTYAALMNSDPVCEAVSQELNGKVSAAAISGMITASRVSYTQVINVVLKCTDPQLVTEVGNALLKAAPDVLQEKAGGQVSPVNSAKFAVLESPNVTANVIYGLIVSLVLACTVVILISVLDTTIWREEDLVRAFDYPVFGSVPGMHIAAQSYKKERGR